METLADLENNSKIIFCTPSYLGTDLTWPIFLLCVCTHVCVCDCVCVGGHMHAVVHRVSSEAAFGSLSQWALGTRLRSSSFYLLGPTHPRPRSLSETEAPIKSGICLFRGRLDQSGAHRTLSLPPWYRCYRCSLPH